MRRRLDRMRKAGAEGVAVGALKVDCRCSPMTPEKKQIHANTYENARVAPSLPRANPSLYVRMTRIDMLLSVCRDTCDTLVHVTD